ncbi:uncharacterized protein UTRI_04127 [Ustilago trichophora]|uniref:WW domain-containing protein n=1 Tax=Ustilago trichophora TaxID=86804 RepID=A0A5C3E7V3_9BASI|nr:uncharacterized protein UTRI_04127 [Ustilago trichophora]
MLSPEEVARDEEIFRADGFIKFPRSDGDANYGPPNTVVPPKTDPEVNYYHIFKREEKRHDTWRSALGEQLAQFFKLPTLSRSKAKWKLYDFPENYHFAEQRKGPANDPRTDPYMFGSQGHRFRSTKEVLDHFVWLLMDPDMNPANCRCKYCHKGPRTSTGGDGTPKKPAQGVKRKGEPISASTAATAGRRGRKPNAEGVEIQNQTSITVRGVEMRRLVPGVTIASVPQRDQEVMHELKRGEKERFRVGEVVWCELDEPVVDPTYPTRKITAWPAVIVDPAVEFTSALGYYADEDGKKTSLEAVSAPTQRATSPPILGGSSIIQSMSYQVTFFGTMEKAKVPESSLTPYLVGLIPNELIESDLGTREDHPWLFKEGEYPHLNLSRQPDLPAPDFTKSIVAFGFAVEAAAVLRNLYSLTDAYSGSDTPEGVLRDLGAAAGDGDKQLPLGMRYYQGIYFGLERIWVGDVVRLKLANNDLKKLQRQLNTMLAADKQPGAPDPAAVILDEDGSYVLQLAAIYEDPRIPKTVRVAGEIFQVMVQSKYNAIKADIEAAVKKLEDDEGMDASQRQEETKALQAQLPQPSILTGKPGFPPMPPLPQGFVMISLTDRLQSRIPCETSLNIGHVAGRIYPSLGMHSDGPRVTEQIKQRPSDKKLAADEDTQIDLRARLSVAGLLSGCVKAMRGTVHAWTRTASFKGALAMARSKVHNLITGEFPDSDAEEATASPSKTPAKKDKTSAAGADAEMPSKTVTGEQSNGATQPQPQMTTTQATQTTQATAADKIAESLTTAATDAEMPPSSEDEPPLPPGWMPRKSRNLGSWYYVHTVTKKTQWERPTA